MALENPHKITDENQPDWADDTPACVLIFNANDPSGAAGLAADVLACASSGVHALSVVTGAYLRDTTAVFGHVAFDDDAVAEQARRVLEDTQVQVIKVGFCGTPDNLSTIAEICSDYADIPVVAYMPNLSWWDEPAMDAYLDAFHDLILPQTTVLVGNHNTLWRWLLPDWASEKSPGPRDLAQAAAEMGVSYVLVTGLTHPDQRLENALASPHTVVVSERVERLEAIFIGAGDTLSITLAAMLANEADLELATRESLHYLEESLHAGFRVGMGHLLPDRLFWADISDDDEDEESTVASAEDFSLHQYETKH